MPINLKVGKWYWIEDPGSNMHAGYSGPAKCISNEPNNDYFGGPTFEFEFYSKDGGPKGGEGFGMGQFGLEDVMRECEPAFGHADRITPESILTLVKDLSAKVQILEKQVEILNANAIPHTISG